MSKKCVSCNNERVVWEMDDFGIMKASPCPNCNENGQEVREETEVEMEKQGKWRQAN